MSLAKIAAVISTLNETNGSPESMLYIFFDMNMDAWLDVRRALLTSGVINVKGHYVTLTEKGRKLATDIDKAVAKKQN